MRNPQRPATYALAFCAVLSLTAMTGCTGDSDGSDKATGKPRPEPTRSSPAHDEQKLGDRVEKALGTGVDDSDPEFVESGLERVSDGVHTRPKLSRGASYKLWVACAGKGKITLSAPIRAEKPTRQTVSCDGVPVVQRITGSRSNLEIEAEGLRGATGMVGWRVSKTE